MQEFVSFLWDALHAIVLAVIPLCAGYAIKLIKRKAEQIGAQTDSLELKSLIEQVADAVSTAVTYTSQTFVDSLKRNGLFDTDAQKQALQMSLDKATSLLSDVAKEALEEVYGDLNEYLTSKIEAEVRNQKDTQAAAVVNVMNTAPAIEETSSSADEESAKMIADLLNNNLDSLKKKAEEYGVDTTCLETKKQIAEAIVMAILQKT